MLDDLPCKTDAVAFMGQTRLLLPNWIRIALAADDRPKLYLSALQASAEHTAHPEREPLDIVTSDAASASDAQFLRNLLTGATRIETTLCIPAFPALAKKLADELAQMACPVVETDHASLSARVREWREWFTRARVGHPGWLTCGREALIFGAMRAAGEGTFRVGDRLDAMLRRVPEEPPIQDLPKKNRNIDSDSSAEPPRE